MVVFCHSVALFVELSVRSEFAPLDPECREQDVEAKAGGGGPTSVRSRPEGWGGQHGGTLAFVVDRHRPTIDDILMPFVAVN